MAVVHEIVQIAGLSTFDNSSRIDNDSCRGWDRREYMTTVSIQQQPLPSSSSTYPQIPPSRMALSNIQNIAKKDGGPINDVTNPNDNEKAADHNQDESDPYQDFSPEYIAARDAVDACGSQQELHALLQSVYAYPEKDYASAIAESKKAIDEGERAKRLGKRERLRLGEKVGKVFRRWSS